MIVEEPLYPHTWEHRLRRTVILDIVNWESLGLESRKLSGNPFSAATKTLWNVGSLLVLSAITCQNKLSSVWTLVDGSSKDHFIFVQWIIFNTDIAYIGSIVPVNSSRNYLFFIFRQFRKSKGMPWGSIRCRVGNSRELELFKILKQNRRPSVISSRVWSPKILTGLWSVTTKRSLHPWVKYLVFFKPYAMAKASPFEGAYLCIVPSRKRDRASLYR